MNRFTSFIAACLLAICVTTSSSVEADDGPPAEARNVILVHGAWADGSSWSGVIPFLLEAGLNVVSVQNPLTSLSDDVAATRRALDAVDGSTVLAGHSYAGTVISEVGVDTRVTALVYVAARAPDADEDFVELSRRFPTMPVRAGIVTENGFSTLREDAFLRYFADGLPTRQAAALHAVQQPVAEDLFAGRTTAAAWRNKPSWYAISNADNTTSPDLQRFLADRMRANVLELDSGHLSILTHPHEIARLILTAAGYQADNTDKPQM